MGYIRRKKNNSEIRSVTLLYICFSSYLFQRIRSKMDIRADYTPKAFKTEITSIQNEKTDTGSFQIVRGTIVSIKLHIYIFLDHLVAWKWKRPCTSAVPPPPPRTFMLPFCNGVNGIQHTLKAVPVSVTNKSEFHSDWEGQCFISQTILMLTRVPGCLFILLSLQFSYEKIGDEGSQCNEDLTAHASYIFLFYILSGNKFS